MEKYNSELREISEWTSPSNIAFVKYWGKHGNQLPSNPSLSMTLKNSVTRTKVTLVPKSKQEDPEFFFGGTRFPEFEPKIARFLRSTEIFFPFLKNFKLVIESSNSFPHSAGIASSASSMSALALCLCDLSGNIPLGEFYRKASEIARYGSGSASRSVFGGFSVWGRTPLIKDSSDEWAFPLVSDILPVFSNLKDTILIVSSAKKKISSSTGHELMNRHPYAGQRYLQANINLEKILNALKTGNSEDFIRVIENEALDLHSLMMSSDPGYLLLEPGTIQIINKIRDFRKQTGMFICFSLDAGPNVHILYPGTGIESIEDFIKTDLQNHCENGKIIWDECGNGPMKIL